MPAIRVKSSEKERFYINRLAIHAGAPLLYLEGLKQSLIEQSTEGTQILSIITFHTSAMHNIPIHMTVEKPVHILMP